MGCSNCFNGCAETTSDQCVKYTGVDIPGLGIVKGDSLLTVENQIINKVLELVGGNGIVPDLDYGELCNLISNNLNFSEDITLNDILIALFIAVCDIDSRVAFLRDDMDLLNSDYDIACLTGVDVDSDTHDILQAVITRLCSIDSDLTALTADLTSNYVLINDINSYIAAYLADIPASNQYSSKMIPYVAVPYFGVTAGFFDITGAGIGVWEKIYLCNGQNLTPDLRGRGLVGATTMGNSAFNPAVDPGIPGNPTYNLNDAAGSNLAYLTNATQLPPHAHSATVTIIDPQHSHPTSKINPLNGSGSELNFDSVGDKEHYGTMSTLPASTGITATATIGSTGASEGHNNIQPVLATNYIIYIP